MNVKNKENILSNINQISNVIKNGDKEKKSIEDKKIKIISNLNNKIEYIKKEGVDDEHTASLVQSLEKKIKDQNLFFEKSILKLDEDAELKIKLIMSGENIENELIENNVNIEESKIEKKVENKKRKPHLEISNIIEETTRIETTPNVKSNSEMVVQAGFEITDIPIIGSAISYGLLQYNKAKEKGEGNTFIFSILGGVCLLIGILYGLQFSSFSFNMNPEQKVWFYCLISIFATYIGCVNINKNNFNFNSLFFIGTVSFSILSYYIIVFYELLNLNIGFLGLLISSLAILYFSYTIKNQFVYYTSLICFGIVFLMFGSVETVNSFIINKQGLLNESNHFYDINSVLFILSFLVFFLLSNYVSHKTNLSEAGRFFGFLIFGAILTPVLYDSNFNILLKLISVELFSVFYIFLFLYPYYKSNTVNEINYKICIYIVSLFTYVFSQMILLKLDNNIEQINLLIISFVNILICFWNVRISYKKSELLFITSILISFSIIAIITLLSFQNFFEYVILIETMILLYLSYKFQLYSLQKETFLIVLIALVSFIFEYDVFTYQQEIISFIPFLFILSYLLIFIHFGFKKTTKTFTNFSENLLFSILLISLVSFVVNPNIKFEASELFSEQILNYISIFLIYFSSCYIAFVVKKEKSIIYLLSLCAFLTVLFNNIFINEYVSYFNRALLIFVLSYFSYIFYHSINPYIKKINYCLIRITFFVSPVVILLSFIEETVNIIDYNIFIVSLISFGLLFIFKLMLSRIKEAIPFYNKLTKYTLAFSTFLIILEMIYDNSHTVDLYLNFAYIIILITLFVCFSYKVSNDKIYSIDKSSDLQDNVFYLLFTFGCLVFLGNIFGYAISALCLGVGVYGMTVPLKEHKIINKYLSVIKIIGLALILSPSIYFFSTNGNSSIFISTILLNVLSLIILIDRDLLLKHRIILFSLFVMIVNIFASIFVNIDFIYSILMMILPIAIGLYLSIKNNDADAYKMLKIIYVIFICRLGVSLIEYPSLLLISIGLILFSFTFFSKIEKVIKCKN